VGCCGKIMKLWVEKVVKTEEKERLWKIKLKTLG